MNKCRLLFIFIAITYNLGAQSIVIGPKVKLGSIISEISGLIHVDGRFYAINDGGNSPEIHEIDTQTGSVLRSLKVKANNTDWEELTYDDTFVYIGDFGNNKGDRKNLAILRFNKTDLLKDSVIPEFINFAYSDQKDFSSRDFQNFDCEAFVSGENGLYIFTKNRLDLKCNLHWIPKNPGTYITQKLDSTGLNYMITGASISPNGKLFLCGYDYTLNYYVSEIKDWKQSNRLKGISNTVKFEDGPRQYESIASLNDSFFIMASESLSNSGSFLVHGKVLKNNTNIVKVGIEGLSAYPNEFISDLTVIYNENVSKICIVNDSGKKVFETNTDKLSNKMLLDLEFLKAGHYILIFKNKNKSIKTIKVDKI